MGIAFYTGLSGMIGFQNKLDVTSHNIANVNTSGYKKQRATFSDLLYTRMNIHGNYGVTETEQKKQGALGAAPADPATPAGQAQAGAGAAAGTAAAASNMDASLMRDMVGHGSRVSSVDLLYGQAGLNFTNYPLDFAINGEGFFAVDKGGSREYTRNGAFDLQMKGKTAYLVTQDGANVLDTKGKQIKLKVGEDGMPDLEGLAKKLGVYFIPNPYGLTPTDNSRFLVNDISGQPKAAKGRVNEPEHSVQQNALETSGVDLGDEMVEIMQAQRAFQLNSRVVQTADQLDEVINNLR